MFGERGETMWKNQYPSKTCSLIYEPPHLDSRIASLLISIIVSINACRSLIDRWLVDQRTVVILKTIEIGGRVVSIVLFLQMPD